MSSDDKSEELDERDDGAVIGDDDKSSNADGKFLVNVSSKKHPEMSILRK